MAFQSVWHYSQETKVSISASCHLCNPKTLWYIHHPADKRAFGNAAMEYWVETPSGVERGKHQEEEVERHMEEEHGPYVYFIVFISYIFLIPLLISSRHLSLSQISIPPKILVYYLLPRALT